MDKHKVAVIGALNMWITIYWDICKWL